MCGGGKQVGKYGQQKMIKTQHERGREKIF